VQVARQPIQDVSRLAFQAHRLSQIFRVGSWTVPQRTAAECFRRPQPEPLLALRHEAKHIGLIAMYAQGRPPVTPQKQVQFGARWHSCNFIQTLEELPEPAVESPSQFVLEFIHQYCQLAGFPGLPQPRKVTLALPVVRAREPAPQIHHDPPPPDLQFQIVPRLTEPPASGHYPAKHLSRCHTGRRKRRPDHSWLAVPVGLGEGAPEGPVERELRIHCFSSPLPIPTLPPA